MILSFIPGCGTDAKPRLVMIMAWAFNMFKVSLLMGRCEHHLLTEPLNGLSAFLASQSFSGFPILHG